MFNFKLMEHNRLMTVETITSVGALTISIGSFLYLNNRVNTSEDSLKVSSDKLNSIILKLNSVDDQGIISSSKIKEILTSLGDFRSDFDSLKEGLQADMEVINQLLTNQQKKIKALEKQMILICQSIGVEPDVDIEIEEPQIKKRVKKKKISAPAIKAKRSIKLDTPANDKELEDDVLKELSTLGL